MYDIHSTHTVYLRTALQATLPHTDCFFWDKGPTCMGTYESQYIHHLYIQFQSLYTLAYLVDLLNLGPIAGGQRLQMYASRIYGVHLHVGFVRYEFILRPFKHGLDHKQSICLQASRLGLSTWFQASGIYKTCPQAAGLLKLMQPARGPSPKLCFKIA